MGSIFQIIIMIMNRLDYPQLLDLQNTSKMSPRTIVIIRNTNSKAYLITQSASKMNVTGTLRPSLSNFDNRKRNMNMSMNMVYYFIVYAELRWRLSRYRTSNNYTRWCLISVLIYKITWLSVLLENDIGEFSILRAYPLQGPTWSCTLIALRSPDRKTTSVDQLCSIELPMYAQWVVSPL